MNEVYAYKEEFENGVKLNEGSQVDSFLCESDIVIYVGNRGAGKTHLMLFKPLPYLSKPYFRAIYFRKMVKDSTTSGGIADKSKEIFGQFGRFNESLQLLTWKFDSGARIVFGNYSSAESEFAEAIQGIEYYKAFIDEVTQISENRFNSIYSNLRNTKGEKTQMFGSCNADPDSWIKHLIWWYIDPDTGYHIPERNGVEMYFYQWGDTILESFWGTTKEEVLEQSKMYIDVMWDKEMAKYGKKIDLIQSLTVFEGKISENIHLMKSGGVKYYGKLLTGSIEMKGRYAKACWKKVNLGDSLVSQNDIDRWFNNSEQKGSQKYASMDIAGGGKNADKVVMWIWEDMHILKVKSTQGLNAKELKDWTTRQLITNGIPYQNFVYDGIGVGFALDGYFEGSIAFMSQAKASSQSVIKFDGKEFNVYKNARSEVAGQFLDVLKDANNTGECGISISEEALNSTHFNKSLKDHIELETKCLRWREDRDGIKQLIEKDEMVKIIGHSPDFLFSMLYRMAFHRGFKPMTTDNSSKLANFIAFRQ